MATTNRQFLIRTGLSLPAGTASQAPLTFQSGINLTALAPGSVEWDGYNLFVSENSTNGTSSSSLSSVIRRTVAYTDSTLTPLISTITAAGTNQATATQITTDNAFVNSSSANSAPYNGIILPAAIAGRSVTIVNNTANPIYVYPQPIITSLATINSSGSLLTITGGSTTTGLYPGMTISYTSGTSGAFAALTVISSIVSSTSFTVSIPPTTALVGATVSIGTSTGINALSNDAAYTIVSYTSVQFTAVGANKWYSQSAAQIAANNGSGGGGTYTPGSLIYASDAFGSLAGLADIATVGVPLLSGGTNTAPSYTAINLASASSGGVSGSTFPLYGILPIANGGTGTNGSGLNSNTATYSLVNSTSTTINFGGSATAINVGSGTGTTTIQNNLAVTGTSILTGNTTITGNLTVSGTQFISNTTNTAIADAVIELDKPATGWLLSDSGYDVGLKYHYYKTSVSFIVTNTTGNGTTTTLTLADSTLKIPVDTIINLGSTLPINGLFRVTASSVGSVSVASAYNSTSTVIGTVSVSQSVSMTSATSVGTTVTVYYASSATLIAAAATISLTGFSNTAYNGTYTVATGSAGSFTVTTSSSNLGTTTAATGSIIVGDLYAFSGWSNDAQSFEFYTEGYESSSAFTGQYGNIKGGSFEVSSPSSVSATNVAAGVAIRIPAKSFYDTTTAASATATQSNTISVGQFTVGALNTSVTYTNAASLYIDNAPIAGSNVTVVNPYAIQVASGNTLLGGNLAVNGGTLSSTAATFVLLNTTVGTLNALGAATTITVGGSSTTSYALNGSTSGSTFTIGGAAATGNSVSINGTTGGTISLSTPVTTGTANIFNTVTGAINVGGAGTTVNIGTAGGASVLNVLSNGTATIATGGPTAAVFNTNVTTANAFGSATSINLAANATSTLTFGTATGAGTTNKITIAANGGTASFDAYNTTGTASLFPTPTGQINIGGSSTTLMIGAAQATVTIGNGGNSTLTISGGSGSAATVNTIAGVATANVFNTVVTIGNLFGTATTLNIANTATTAITGSIGTSSTAGSTYTFGGAITTGTNAIKIGAAAGGIASFDATTATATGALFTTVTGTVNIGGAGSTINLGTTASNTILNINSSVNASIQATTASTANLFNTSTTTTGNLFGYSTTINVAGSVATGTGSTLTHGSAVTAGVTNTIKINTNGGIASFDAAAATATAMLFNSVSAAITIGTTSGTTTVKSPNVYIGVATADNTLTVNGNGTTGTASVSSNVTTGTVNLFTDTTGTITIGGSSISSGLGVVKLGTSPSQLATGNEVVTANWVLNNINSTASTSVNTGTNVTSQLIDYVTGITAGSFVVGTSYTISSLGTTTNTQWNTIAGTSGVTYNVGSIFIAATTGASSGTGTAYTGQAFNWYQYRSAKYTIQATQVGSTSTRAQTSEILITHDVPVLVFSGATTVGNSTTLTVVSNSGLYVGMTLMITTNGGSDTINGSATGVTTITAISGTSVTLANASTITSGTTLRAFVATSFSASITAANSTTSVTYAGMTALVGCAYPGMYITGTGVTANTYITSINNTTGTITLNQALATAAGAVISGTPNVYVTEYSVLETNGTIGIFTAAPTTTAPYHIQLTTTPLITTSNISLGTLVETVFKLEKQLIELV